MLGGCVRGDGVISREDEGRIAIISVGLDACQRYRVWNKEYM